MADVDDRTATDVTLATTRAFPQTLSGDHREAEMALPLEVSVAMKENISATIVLTLACTSSSLLSRKAKLAP